jgi:hypothetical protein
MRCQFLTGTLLIEGCTFRGNSTNFSEPAGAVWLGSNSGSINVRNSTFTGNGANGQGGAIGFGGTGTCTILNSTIFDNDSIGAGGGVARTQSTAGAITVQNSVISGNNSGGGAPDISGGTVAVNVNFSAIGSASGFTLSGTSGNNLAFGATLNLDVLANNGGPTQTMRPLSNSLLNNAGSNALASGLSADQRGSGFARVSGAAVDIGAVERQETPQTFTVTNANDSGAGSLRSAIDQTNFFEGNDTIAFDATFFATPRTISLLTALAAFRSSNSSGALTITGPGSSRLTVRRDPSALNFRIFDSGITSTLSISGMVVSGGYAAGGNGGGGLRSASLATVTLDDVDFINNGADNQGGAIELPTANELSLHNCTFSGNLANTTAGGAISFDSGGALLIDSCTFTGNSSPSAFTNGGAIRFFGTASASPPAGFTPSTLVVLNSTFNNNSTGGNGGAISCVTFTGTLLIQNSTFNGNTAGTGGAVMIGSGGPGSVTLQDSTISGNTATDIGSGTGGGGIARTSSFAGNITLQNSIVSGNNSSSSGPDIFRAFAATTVNANFSAIGNAGGFALSGTSGNNLAFGTNLMLGALANNGGPTQTMQPALASPLIGAGFNALVPMALTTDQRGPGFARIINGTVDIGAVERQERTFVVTTDADSGTGSLRDAMTQAVGFASDDTIQFDPAFFGTAHTITLVTQLPFIASTGGTLTISGPGSSLLTVRRNPAAGNFPIFNNAAPALSISGLTATGGQATTTGGAITTGGTSGQRIALDDVVLTGNSAGSDGGAIRISLGGFLTIRNSTISNNTAPAGGALYFQAGGSLLLENTTISGNTATSSPGGGAVYFTGTASATPPAGFTPSTLVLKNSTINNNTLTLSTANGAGFCLENFTGTLLLQNSTIANNSGARSGGGAIITGGNGSITLQNSTITGNSATGTSAGTGGGGIARTSIAGGSINLVNSIVAGNTNTPAPDIMFPTGLNTTVNANFSAIGSAGGFTLSGSSANNLPFGASLLLGLLANNGGPTQTILPASNSPLVNAGSNALVPAGITTDQRGPGFARIVGAAVDIGALEVQAQPPTVINSQFNVLTSQSLAFTFSEAVTFPNGINAAFTVQNLSNSSTVTTSAVQNGATVTVTFSPAILPDANFHATVVAANVLGAGGALAADQTLDFFFLNGDANRDHSVSLLDFNILAANFGQSNRNFSQGDFNYDGSVSLLDFNILSSRFGMSTSASALFSRTRIGATDRVDTDSLRSLLN